ARGDREQPERQDGKEHCEAVKSDLVAHTGHGTPPFREQVGQKRPERSGPARRRQVTTRDCQPMSDFVVGSRYWQIARMPTSSVACSSEKLAVESGRDEGERRVAGESSRSPNRSRALV